MSWDGSEKKRWFQLDILISKFQSVDYVWLFIVWLPKTRFPGLLGMALQTELV